MADFEEQVEEGSSQLSGTGGGRWSRISNIPSSMSMSGTGTNSLFGKAALSQRIVSVEYYMTAPVKEFDNLYSDFRSSAVKRVPVLRIFGSSPAGQKICANVHGVYPYISILDDGTVDGFEYKIAKDLDNAINDSIVTNKFGKDPMSYNNTQHVFKVLRVVGRTFYGYRSNNEVFLRIFFYNPMILKKAVDLLQSGSILGRRFQPYEAHIPYSLQFMIDYNLYGMNFVHYSFVKYRRKESSDDNLQIEGLLPSSQGSVGSNCSISSFVDTDTLPESLLGPRQLIKSTLCELEVDVLASDILMDTNASGKSINPGIDSIWKDEIERRRQHGVEDCSQITIPESQERSQAELVHSTEDKHRQILWAKVQSFFDDSVCNANEEMDTSVFESSQQSLMEDPEIENLTRFSSSQVHDHLSGESKNEAVSDNRMSQEELEFVKLLEEMAENADEQKEDATYTNFNTLDDPAEIEDDDSLNADAGENEDIWDDSFLSSSILEKISDAEMSYEESRKNDESSGSNKSPVILQCDGQGGDSDSSSDELSVSTRTRGSPHKLKIEDHSSRKSRQSSKLQGETKDGSSSKAIQSNDKQRRKSNRLSSSVQPSPANRLSLTLRRKSRSQEEARKSSSQKSSTSTSSTKSVTRKSTSIQSSPKNSSSSVSETKGSVDGEPLPKTKKGSRKDEPSSSKKPLEKDSSVSKSIKSSAPTPTRTDPKTESKAAPEKSSGVSKSIKSSAPATISSTAPKTESKKDQEHNSSNYPTIPGQFLNAATQKIQQPRICLQKIDDEVLLATNQSKSKRPRRKPKRFLEDDIDATSTSSSASINTKNTRTNSTESKEILESNSTTESESEQTSAVNSELPTKNLKKKTSQQVEVLTKSKVIGPQQAEENSEHSEALNDTEKEVMNSKNEHPNRLLIKRKKIKKKRLGMPKIVGNSTAQSLPSSTKVPESLHDQNDTCKSTSTASVQSLRSEIKDCIKREKDINSDPSPVLMSSAPLPTNEVGMDEQSSLISVNPLKPNLKEMSNNHSTTVQTDRILSTDMSVQAQPETMNKSSQILTVTQVMSTQTPTVEMTDAETHIPTIEMKSVETQTDLVKPLCLCQCTCVIKEKVDAGIDTQDELKPTMESRRIQVDNVDIITRMRSARFTTPKSNKIRIATPSRSPEKRRPITDSPKRRPGGVMLPGTHSRFLNALVLKTPTTTHKYRSSLRESPSTPTASISPAHYHRPKTPPSKEEYLMSLLRSTCSPRNKRCSIKPRNLHIETDTGGKDEIDVGAGNENSDAEIIESGPSTEEGEGSITSNSDVEAEPIVKEDDPELPEPDLVECDLSVNSIYLYEDPASLEIESIPSSPAPSQSQILSDASCNNDENIDDANNDVLTPPNQLPPTEESPLSSFQKKRILSRNRSRIRLEKRKTATLEANREIPDIFDVEFEPLKQPPSYKSTMKWLEAEKHRNPYKNIHQQVRDETSEDLFDNSSDEEEVPPSVKLFGGGNMSDEEDSDSPNSGSSKISADENCNGVKPFTPPTNLFRRQSTNFDESNQSQGSTGNETPRSILRQRGCSRRQSGGILKRKIRWDDEGEEESNNKRLKMDNIENENGSSDSCPLTNESLNRTADTSELDGPSMKNALGLENSMSNYQDVKALQQCQFVTTMCVEVHCASRSGLTPDPALDPILAIFVLISSDYPENFRRPKEHMNILLVDNVNRNGLDIESCQSMKAFSTEMEMIEAFFGLVRFWDPDILVGYEVEKFSFGYLIQRGFHLGKDTAQELSRVLPPVRKDGKRDVLPRRNEEWNGTISGRIVLNLWRLLRHEIAVNSYTFENAAYHILRRRVYKLPFKTLTGFWAQIFNRRKVIEYYTVRIKGVIQIMDKLDLINRTSELARLFGIQFYEVFSRGSQFRVESMMLRATKRLDYVAPSATITQRAKMRAPEYLPLILEPRSNYYTDPVAVLDFQSLYPSMMIAYNYDYASVIGRVEHLGSTDRFPIGCLDHEMSPGELLKLKDHIHISPAGVAFLDKSLVRGILPEMLEQILETRQMVKRAMKKWKNEGLSLKKVLDSRQLGLKLIANVTYGYTSANFSGRMPCVDIADSIVSKGRETLQRAIDFVKDNYNRWGAEVIYGDTDSMFLLFRHKSREQAFKLAYEIADEVTQANPKPVKLKFEKVYQPCILQSKKRYVGYAYETPDQEKPIYDAKGIETVRRDGCPAVRKILEKTLHILFATNKPSKVEDYVKLQFEKLFKGRVSMQDYIFAREFRGRSGYKPTACVPALEIAKKLTAVDPRAEPLTSERVPYIVAYGDPNLPLIRLVRRPEEYLENGSMRLNAHYYIEKVIIPALNRCLLLAKMDASKWYLQMPRKFLRNVLEQKANAGGQRTLDNYILHQNCFRCDSRAERWLCDKCLEDETSSVIYLQEIIRNSKLKLSNTIEICTNCSGDTADRCVSIDCPILHKLIRYERDQPYVRTIERELINLEW